MIANITFRTAVQRGQRAIKAQSGANWILGDLALTVKPEYGDNTVRKLAEALDIAPGTLYDLRKVAESYAISDRSEANSWTVHQVLSREDDRAVLVKSTMTVSAARALVKSRKPDAANTDDNGTDDNGTDTVATVAKDATPQDRLAAAIARVTRLESELDAARADVAQLEAEISAAAKPAVKPRATRTAPKATAPKATAPKATAPKATAPKATAPKATAPKVTAPKATAAKPRATRKTTAAKRATHRAKTTAPKAATVALHMTFRGVPEHAAGTMPGKCVSCSPKTAAARAA